MMSFRQGQIVCDSSHWSSALLPPKWCETVEQKLVKISGDLFCHNNGLKKQTINLPPIAGDMPLFW